MNLPTLPFPSSGITHMGHWRRHDGVWECVPEPTGDPCERTWSVNTPGAARLLMRAFGGPRDAYDPCLVAAHAESVARALAVLSTPQPLLAVWFVRDLATLMLLDDLPPSLREGLLRAISAIEDHVGG